MSLRPIKKQAMGKTHSLLYKGSIERLVCLATDQAIKVDNGDGVAEFLGNLLSILLDLSLIHI